MTEKDYSQLPALKILLTEKNVSRAADRMGLSQPAMSRIFAKLKRDFADPLMVRAGNQYQLTTRAQVLLQQLNQLMPQIENLWQGDELTLDEIDQTVVISGTDMDVVYISDAISQMCQKAPNLHFAIRTSTPRTIDDLLSAEVDLVLTAFDDERAGIYRQTLFEEHFAVVAGKNCPLKACDMNLETYLAQRHGKFSFAEPTRGRVDAALEELGIRREISLSLPTFLQIPPFLSDPELLFSVPKSFAQYLANHFAIKILPLPFKPRPLKIYLYWHERQHHNKLHQWVRQNLLRSQINPLS